MTKDDLIKLKEKLNELSDEEKKMYDIYLRKMSTGELQQPVGYPSIDKPWLKYYDRDFSEDEIPNKSIYQFALESNIDNMNKTAIDMRISKNDFSKGIKLSYKDLFNAIEKSGKASSAIGVRQDEIVPFILPNVPEARILVYSSSMLGSISYPVSPLMPVNQLEKFLSDNNIKNLFIFDAFYEKYASALKNAKVENIVLLNGSESLPISIQKLEQLRGLLTGKNKEIFKDNKRVMSWIEYISYAKNVKNKIEPYYKENHIAAIIGTSGTTGVSKGVCLTDKNVNASACSYLNGNVFEGNFMDALLPSIGYGISMMHFQTIAGKYVYLIPELLTTRFPEALFKLKPDNFPGGPVHYINLRESEYFKNKSIPKAKNLISGGASLPHELERTLNGVKDGYCEDGINDELIVRQGYGLSENVATGTYSKRGSYKFGSIGIPMPSIMQGYLNNEIETKKVIKLHSDGKKWIHTKDIGYMDEDGHIFHVDRIKNIFMRTGFNVHPSKIAEFINTIPIVKNSVVIGFEHAKEQCVPIAFVELNEEYTFGKNDEELQNEIMKKCYDNLEETSVPYGVVFVDSLPINLGGKIDQITIKEKSGIDLIKNPKIKKRIKFDN